MAIPEWVHNLAQEYDKLRQVADFIADSVYLSETVVGPDDPRKQLFEQVKQEMAQIRFQLEKVLNG
jgi:hypothetical protein